MDGTDRHYELAQLEPGATVSRRFPLGQADRTISASVVSMILKAGSPYDTYIWCDGQEIVSKIASCQLRL